MADASPVPARAPDGLVRSWWEDPRLHLDQLTPGQRYTAVLVAILTVLLLMFGLPGALPGLRASAGATPSPSSGAAAGQDQGAPASSSPSGFWSVPPPDAVAGIPGLPAGEAAGALSADSGSVPGAPGSPTPSSPTCPVSPPTTGTAVDAVSSELAALCQELLSLGSGTVPTGSLPGGSSAAALGGGESLAPGAAGSAEREEWAFADAPVGVSGSSARGWPSSLTVEMTGKDPTVTLVLVQTGSVSPALVRTLGQLVQHGTLVQVLLVPQPHAAGGPAAFGSWVTKVLAGLEPVELVEIGAGAAPAGSSAATSAAYTAAGIAAARHDAAEPATGVLWLDGGTSSGDEAVWSSLDSTATWSSSSFVARSLDATAACSSPTAFVAMVRGDRLVAALPIVSEAVAGSAPAGGAAAESSCLQSSTATDPVASLAVWRQWQGPR